MILFKLYKSIRPEDLEYLGKKDVDEFCAWFAEDLKKRTGCEVQVSAFGESVMIKVQEGNQEAIGFELEDLGLSYRMEYEEKK